MYEDANGKCHQCGMHLRGVSLQSLTERFNYDVVKTRDLESKSGLEDIFTRFL